MLIGRRNSFAPLITGTISSHPGDTTIAMKMELLPSAKIFMAFWLGIVGFICIMTLLAGLLKLAGIIKIAFTPMVLIPFAMFIFGCFLTIAGFRAQCKISNFFLETILEGKIVKAGLDK